MHFPSFLNQSTGIRTLPKMIISEEPASLQNGGLRVFGAKHRPGGEEHPSG